MGLAQIKMPQLGESVTEGTVEKWLKSEGDFVKRDEPIVEVVTDKVNAEIPSPFEGKLVKITVTEGETVRVGAVIAQIETAGGAAADAPSAPAKQPATPAKESATPAKESAAPPLRVRTRAPRRSLRLHPPLRATTEAPTELGFRPPSESSRPSTASTPRRFGEAEWAAGSPETMSSPPSKAEVPLQLLLLLPPRDPPLAQRGPTARAKRW
jgi:pyruvate dehydrogenase E2 component (dihydrolipoamide acetyltransferase)